MTLMQRMSDMLTRWLDGNIRPDQAEAGATSAAGEGSSNPEAGEEPQGAEGRGDTPTGRRPGVQEHQGLIQDLESMEIPRQPHCDITDTLRSLSKYHQPGASRQPAVKRSCNTQESFKLSTSPCPEDMAEADQESSVTDFQISQNAPESCESGATGSKAEPTSSCDHTTLGASNNKDVESTLRQQHPSRDAGAESSESGHVTPDARPLRKGQDWIEPVISLNYSTEGTTSSTIQVEFTSFPPEDPVPGLSQSSSAMGTNRTSEPLGKESQKVGVTESHNSSGNETHRLTETKNDSSSVDTCSLHKPFGNVCSSETAACGSSSSAVFDSEERHTVGRSSRTAAVHSSKMDEFDSSGMPTVDSLLTAGDNSLESAAVDSSADNTGDEYLMHSVEVIKAGVSSGQSDENSLTGDCEQEATTDRQQVEAVSSREADRSELPTAQERTRDQGRQSRAQETGKCWVCGVIRKLVKGVEINIISVPVDIPCDG